MTKSRNVAHVHYPTAQRLHILSRNLWWTWNPEAQEIFRTLSPMVWKSSNHNAVAVLREISEDELLARLHDSDLMKRVRTVLEEFESYLGNKRTWARKHASMPDHPIAYFSAEYGLHESLPIYSGGLGVLSGDHLKSASDLGLNFVGVGLFYRNGYFTQHIGPDGWQQELYPASNPEELAMELVLQKEGGRLLNSVEIGHTTVFFQTWLVRIGRIRLYLMDTNVPENDAHVQTLTAYVYGGDINTRIGQEIILGIGGVRLLKSLGIDAGVYHMNEGHSAFLSLELLREELHGGKSRQDAEKRVRAKCVFTTHTPVPAGHDRFSGELMRQTLEKFWSSTGLDFDTLMSYGRVHPDDAGELFTMTVLALKMSKHANGVSELHGQVSREMWKDLYPGTSVDEVPIGHITNGIHTPGWATRHAHEFWNKRLGFDWTEKLMDQKFWKRIQSGKLASDEELWALRFRMRRDLIEFARTRLGDQLRRSGGDGSVTFDKILSPNALTIGFARRFATYKRAPLIFRHLERMVPLLANPERPVQILFAGKAHPRDNEGKKFIQKICEMTHHPQLAGRVVFIENYDLNVARHLISGADVWLNNPRRPLEASGTSGQKICIHGGLNLSILDGWWREGYKSDNGWAIGDDEQESNLDAQDEKDFENLYKVLSEQVINEFYDRDAHDIPRKWIQRIRNSMESLVPQYNTDRMVAEYVRKYYAR
ncbi:MAG TPA: alpha-glucan family phosphorylase [Bacteroidota bacterium]